MAFNKKQVDNFFQRAGYELETGRKTMDALRKRFNVVKRQLKKENVYQATDEFHIVTLVMCEEIQLRAFMDVMEKGTLMTVDRDQKVYQKNHAISTFYQMGKLMNDTSAKLGLSPLDRVNLKLEPENPDGMTD